MVNGGTPGRTAFRLGAVVFISTLGVGIFAFAFPLLALRDNIPGGWLGAVFSSYFLAKLIVAPLAGPLADRTGPRPLLLGATLVSTVAPLGYFVFPCLESLYIIQFLLGLTGGVLKPVAMAAMSSVTHPRSRGKAFGWCNAAYNGAFFLSPALGGLLFYNMDLSPVVLVVLLCMGSSFLGVLLLVPSAITSRTEARQGDTATPGIRSWPLMLAIFGRTMGIAAMITFYPMLLAARLHGPTWIVGILFAVPSLVSFLVLPVGGRMADTGNKLALTLAGMGMASLGLSLLPLASSLTGFILTGGVIGTGSALSFPAAIAMGTERRSFQGRVMGLLHGSANAGFVAGPILCGLLVEQSGNVSAAFPCAGGFGLLLCLPLLLDSIPSSIRDRLWQSFSPVAVCGLAVLALVFIITNGSGRLESRASAAQDGPEQTLQTYADVAMGNVVRMTVYADDTSACDAAAAAARNTIHRLESDFSHRNGSGSVGRVNLEAGVRPVAVTPETFKLVRRALDMGTRTAGAFDVTIGAVTSLPFYYRERAQKDKSGLVDYRKVVLDEPARTIFLPEPGMALDLGGLAKGTVVDSAARVLREHGATAGLVEAGGDFYCFGDRTWTVGIQNPRGEGLLGTVKVRSAGVCGSGDYYQFALAEDNGTRKHHILDPDKLNAAHASIAVTVIAPTAELADALATTMFILGPDKGTPVLNSFPGSSALWVLPDRSTHTSPTFPPLEH